MEQGNLLVLGPSHGMSAAPRELGARELGARELGARELGARGDWDAGPAQERGALQAAPARPEHVPSWHKDPLPSLEEPSSDSESSDEPDEARGGVVAGGASFLVC